MNMAKTLRNTILSASIVWSAVALVVEHTHAQWSCLAADVAKDLLSNAGVSTNEASSNYSRCGRGAAVCEQDQLFAAGLAEFIVAPYPGSTPTIASLTQRA
jgi:hypothetical protein